MKKWIIFFLVLSFAVSADATINIGSVASGIGRTADGTKQSSNVAGQIAQTKLAQEVIDAGGERLAAQVPDSVSVLTPKDNVVLEPSAVGDVTKEGSAISDEDFDATREYYATTLTETAATEEATKAVAINRENTLLAIGAEAFADAVVRQERASKAAAEARAVREKIDQVQGLENLNKLGSEITVGIARQIGSIADSYSKTLSVTSIEALTGGAFTGLADQPEENREEQT